MLMDIESMREQNAGSTDDLDIIRRMVHRTGDNVDGHIEHVGGMKYNLDNMDADSKDF